MSILKRFDPFGKDSLMKSTLPYYIINVFILVSFYCIETYRNSFIPIFIIYSLLPVLDQLFVQDWRNPSPQQVRALQKDSWFKLPLYLQIVLDWYVYIRAIQILVETPFQLQKMPFILSTLFIVGNLCAVGFMVAHQLFHKNSVLDKIVGTLHMVKSLYIHFTVQHLYGHHRHVATPMDSASAHLGQNLYKFIVQSVIGSVKSSYLIQRDRFNKPFYSNLTVISLSLNATLLFAVNYLFGLKTCLIFLTVAAISVFYLEAINYIEHYGLQRKQLADGTYQPVNITHSWNSPHRFSNYLLFKLQRHSDHHQNSFKPYQILNSLPQSPMLPHGYPIMVMIALISPAWHWIMDPLAKRYQLNRQCIKQQMRKAEQKTRLMTGLIAGTTLTLAIMG